MNKRILIFFTLALTGSLPGLSRDFEYTYKGQTLTYTVADEDKKTCVTKAGYGYPEADLIGFEQKSGNTVSGSLEIPENASDGNDDYEVVGIGLMSFFHCEGLTSVTLPSTLNSIETKAFQATGLTAIKLPASIESLGIDIFRDCESMVSAELPDGMEIIPEGMFCRCNKLSEVKLPEGLTTIGNSAFSYCMSLPEISLPETLTTLGTCAFSNCRSLSEIIIPETVVSIGGSAFAGCKGFKQLVLPAALKTLGEGALAGCVNISSIELPDAIEVIDRATFSKCESLKNISFSKNLRRIDKNAFDGCRLLDCVDLPKSVSYIGADAFNECSNLTTIMVNSVTPPWIFDETFMESTYENATLVVPLESADVYRANKKWRRFLTQTSGVTEVETSEDVELARYGLDGTRKRFGSRGISIIIDSKGRAKKVLVRD